ncbi:hypothetical protein CONLIGDRAFT_648107 [Coniochaeta ligniaria NRRL 30616]|uniref:Uncharacterized protein n=1 Tax=Coniochaeta ligniaria NRRL 30616 TaxID=1408157 RepID=A0A1J7ICN3_9PEZI|nr:hypothetical protein CONLIGDRAFT_648107 [Coniochaeta ligniaria NRRL 30616]
MQYYCAVEWSVSSPVMKNGMAKVKVVMQSGPDFTLLQLSCLEGVIIVIKEGACRPSTVKWSSENVKTHYRRISAQRIRASTPVIDSYAGSELTAAPGRITPAIRPRTGAYLCPFCEDHPFGAIDPELQRRFFWLAKIANANYQQKTIDARTVATTKTNALGASSGSRGGRGGPISSLSNLDSWIAKVDSSCLGPRCPLSVCD